MSACIPAAQEPAGGLVRGLAQHLKIGGPVRDMPDCWELLIDFGHSGFVARYRHAGDQLTVLALRHQREAGYRT